ncbi:MAG TPA: PQQ-binding-like beta-propeller repeat protein [Candidatus Binatia bacterium]|nr:PQQ-binding-like beta-propeller repeat protein [Candidatus Binatia bacterium]
MQTTNKNKTASIALIIVLTISMALLAAPTTVHALDIPTYTKIHVEPDPVGQGQPAYISAFLTKPTATASMNNVGDRYAGITIKITDPDGQVTTMGPYTADTTGGIGGLKLVPTKLGNYTLVAYYPGQNLTGSTYKNVVELPSQSDPETLMVQQEQIPWYSSAPLPTEYWSRPINAQNYQWTQLAGSWYGLAIPSFASTGSYDAQGNFNPYSPAPNTGHIMWTKPTAFGGQVGGPIPGDQESQFTSTSILLNYFEPIVLDGVLYYGEMAGINSQVVSWNAVDLRTGQTLWTEQPGVTANATSISFEKLRMGQNLKFHSMQEYGTTSFLYSIVGGGMFGGSATYRLYEPFTGAYMGVIYNVTTDSAYLMDTDPTHENPGTLLGYFTTRDTDGVTKLMMWNSTLMMGNGNLASEILRPGKVMNFTSGIQWKTPVPTNISGNSISMSVAARTKGIILLRQAPLLVTQTSAGYAISAAYNAHTGALLWGPINQTMPLYGDMSLLSSGQGWVDPDGTENWVYVLHNKDTHELFGYSLNSSNLLWGPVKLPGSALSTLTVAGDIAYGNVYVWDFGGYVSAVDLKTGAIKWTYTPRNAGLDTPYGTYPLWVFGSQSIADGKLFLSESHMYDPPLFPNARRLALNATDGSLVWSISSFSGRSPGAIADGYLVEWNSYDNQIYTFGKGPTAITASVQNPVATEGGTVLISGTVTDTSPGTQNSDRMARFPQGVPAVSDESQSDWMEYVYMQQPKPSDATGVPVTLSVLDSNGNYREIGQATTDLSGFYSFQWTPDIPGKYTLFASFGGSESYWPSNTEASFAVNPAAATPTPSPIPVQSVTDMYFVPAVAGIIVVIAIVGAVLAILTLRKRP